MVVAWQTPRVGRWRVARRSQPCAAATLATALTFTLALGAGASGAPAGWTAYHGGGAGVAALSSVSVSSRAWTSPVLAGQLYGQPLEFDGRVYVATEADVVYALSAATGRIIWRTRVGKPVPSSALPCGNISPTVGVTGTPVIDPARHELFAVADEVVAGAPRHVLVGLSTVTGRRLSSRDVDPARADPAALLQRTGLALDAGRVVFGFGGNYGDCASYRGRVVAVPEGAGAPRFYTVDSGAGEHEGAVWMGGAAPVVDSAGHVWVEVGNGSVGAGGGPYDRSDSVLELSAAMHLVQFFAPSTWRADNDSDLDLSAAPALLGDDLVVAAGKGGRVYLLRRGALGGVGHPLDTLTGVCGGDFAGGVAVSGDVAYLPCQVGIIAVRAAGSSLSVAWASSSGGGPPVVAGGAVWSIGSDGALVGLDPASGSVVATASVGAEANNFPTPGAGDGLLLVPTASRVVAFS